MDNFLAPRNRSPGRPCSSRRRTVEHTDYHPGHSQFAGILRKGNIWLEHSTYNSQTWIETEDEATANVRHLNVLNKFRLDIRSPIVWWPWICLSSWVDVKIPYRVFKKGERLILIQLMLSLCVEYLPKKSFVPISPSIRNTIIRVKWITSNLTQHFCRKMTANALCKTISTTFELRRGTALYGSPPCFYSFFGNQVRKERTEILSLPSSWE